MSGFKSVKIRMNSYVEFIDITQDIRKVVSEANIKDGIVLVYTPHTTAGITINENADPSVRLDIGEFIKKKIPHECYFKHMEGNSPSHIMSSLFSASESLIIEDGQIVLGTWQGIFFCEFDGPRIRNVFVKVLPALI